MRRDTAPPTIRRARPDEAGALTELGLRSKARWGYDAAFVEDCREALTVSARRGRERHPFFVAEQNGPVVGFYGLVPLATADRARLLFVEPGSIGRGHGRRLFRASRGDGARGSMRQHLLIQSDPHAEGFYLAMGAERVGELPSPLRQERALPILRYPLGCWGPARA